MKKYRDKKGFTLLEMLLVLAIVIAIILIAGRYYTQASDSSKVSNMVSRVRRIIDASYEWEKVTKSFIVKDPNGSTLSIKALQQMNLLPPNDEVGPWGCDVTVLGGSATSIKITITCIPMKSCLALTDNLTPQNMQVYCYSSKPDMATAIITYPNTATTP